MEDNKFKYNQYSGEFELIPKELACPDCGSTYIRECPLDCNDYICHDCGLFFNKDGSKYVKQDNK